MDPSLSLAVYGGVIIWLDRLAILQVCMLCKNMMTGGAWILCRNSISSYGKGAGPASVDFAQVWQRYSGAVISGEFDAA